VRCVVFLSAFSSFVKLAREDRKKMEPRIGKSLVDAISACCYGVVLSGVCERRGGGEVGGID
jgi:hypothetical protein